MYYGAQRVDAKGRKTGYEIKDSAIQQQPDGVLLQLVIYDWQGHAYICLENVGELDQIGDADGTCPYEIVATARGDHTEGEHDARPKEPQ